MIGRIGDHLRVEDLGHEIVVLDGPGGRVHRLTGAAADAIRVLRSGGRIPASMELHLREAGILEAVPDRRGISSELDRRAVLAASALGISTVLLPGSAAAASPAGLSEGGSDYLIVSGPAATSSGSIGTLQYVTFTLEVAGTRYVTATADLAVEVLLVGGGGGGAVGGGGGGAVTREILTLTGLQQYDITVGTGGAAGTGLDDGGAGGGSRFVRNSDASELLAAAGGAGGFATGAGGSSTGAGGAAGTLKSGGGGGGAGDGAGGQGSDAVGGDGGSGGAGDTVTDFITASETYGGGGGGGSYYAPGAAGGAGGGGAGGAYGYGTVTNGVEGAAASGGGGGGASGYGGAAGGGGTGLVAIRYYGAQPQVELGFGAG